MRLPLVVETGDSVRDGASESVGIGEGTISEIMLLNRFDFISHTSDCRLSDR